MDGIHDLGGMEGFGPVPVRTGDKPFRDLADWEKRMYALARNNLAPGITIDWFRHSIERMVPADYLNFPYFKKWCTTYMVLMIDTGSLTLDEVKTGHAAKASDKKPDALFLEDVLEKVRTSNFSFEVPVDSKPVYSVSDRVRTKRRMDSPHTRLPRYARDVSGTVIAYHGAHAFPDEGAKGKHVGDHLYTVSFGARDLWGETANPNDSVAMEVWENYLVQT